jgi:hypothetical protein
MTKLECDKSELRMTNEFSFPALRHSDFLIVSSFGFRHSSFTVIFSILTERPLPAWPGYIRAPNYSGPSRILRGE